MTYTVPKAMMKSVIPPLTLKVEIVKIIPLCHSHAQNMSMIFLVHRMNVKLCDVIRAVHHLHHLSSCWQVLLSPSLLNSKIEFMTMFFSELLHYLIYLIIHPVNKVWYSHWMLTFFSRVVIREPRPKWQEGLAMWRYGLKGTGTRKGLKAEGK